MSNLLNYLGFSNGFSPNLIIAQNSLQDPLFSLAGQELLYQKLWYLKFKVGLIEHIQDYFARFGVTLEGRDVIYGLSSDSLVIEKWPHLHALFRLHGARVPIDLVALLKSNDLFQEVPAINVKPLFRGHVPELDVG